MMQAKVFDDDDRSLGDQRLAVLKLITSSYLVGAYRAGFDKAARSPSGSAATP
jgi:hypothetical protein